VNRLQLNDVVELSATTTLKARVVAIDRLQVALHAVDPVELVWLGEETHDVLMLFRHRSQRVALKGSLYYRGGFEELGFVVTDKFCGPAERSTSVPLCAPVWITPLDGSGRELGDPLPHQTAEVAADGVTLEPGAPVEPGRRVKVGLVLPEDPVPAEADAVVEHAASDADGLRLRFMSIAQTDRAKVHRHVVDARRRDLKRTYAPREVGYVW
jgi:hypothetical protein